MITTAEKTDVTMTNRSHVYVTQSQERAMTREGVMIVAHARLTFPVTGGRASSHSSTGGTTKIEDASPGLYGSTSRVRARFTTAMCQ